MVFGVLAVVVSALGVGLAVRAPHGGRVDPWAASRVCRQFPVAKIGGLLGGEIGLYSYEREGDAESCVYVHPPANRSTIPLGTVVEINGQPGRGGYLPDAVPEAFTAVAAVGDAAHYHPIWGLVFRQGELVVHLDVSRSPFSLEYPQPDLEAHASVARLLSHEL